MCALEAHDFSNFACVSLWAVVNCVEFTNARGALTSFVSANKASVVCGAVLLVRSYSPDQHF